MSDNLLIKDGQNAPKTIATQEVNGVHTPKHIVSYSELPNGAASAAKQDNILTGLGALNETAYAGTGGKGLNGLLKGIYNVLTGRILIQNNFGPSGVTAIEDTLTEENDVSAPFTPVKGRRFNITLSGTFVGTVKLQRSFNGTDWFSLTKDGNAYMSFTAPCSEYFEEHESGVTYRLICTTYTSGTVSFRLSQ